MTNVTPLTVKDTSQKFQDFLKKTYPDSADVKPASDWIDEVDYLLDNPPNQQGDRMPWDKTWKTVRLRPSELSIWAGVGGHGKSALNGQILATLANEGQGVMVASMEMRPEKTIERMIKQMTGGASPDKRWRAKFFERMDGNLWIYDQLGSVDPKRILDVTRYAADVLDCSHIQVDSLTKVKGLRDDYAKQADLVNDLQNVAFDYKTHVHLIAHMRKGDSENKMPDKFDLRGASDIADQADNIFIVWQNKKKIGLLQALEQGLPEHELTDTDRKLLEKPDTILRCAKQRHGEWEGPVHLWFGRPGSYQFVGRKGDVMHPPGFAR